MSLPAHVELALESMATDALTVAALVLAAVVAVFAAKFLLRVIAIDLAVSQVKGWFSGKG